MPHFRVVRKYITSETCIVEAPNKEAAMTSAQDDDLNVVIINDSSTDYEAHYSEIDEANEKEVMMYEAVKSRDKRN